ncbi:MAG: hypothetical protein ACJ8F3_16875 [Xanthobacteraceae bacterium]
MTRRKRAPQQDLTKLLESVVANCRNPARLLELYYYSLEPELAEVMRQFMALTPQVRATLHGFLGLAEQDPHSVSLRVNEAGEIVLSGSAIAELARTLAAQRGSSAALH